MTIEEFEKKVWDDETIRIVVRADRFEQVDNYEYQNRNPGKHTLKKWLNNRIFPVIGDNYRDRVVVIAGTGRRPRRNTKVSTVRDTYNTT